MLNWIKSLFAHKCKWKRVKTIWPYPDGYGWYCRGCRTLIDIEEGATE